MLDSLNPDFVNGAILAKEVDMAVESIFLAFDESNVIANALEALEAPLFPMAQNSPLSNNLQQGPRQIKQSLDRRPRPDIATAIRIAVALVESAKGRGSDDAVAQSYFALGICYTALEFQEDSDRQEENQYSAIQCLKRPLQHALSSNNFVAAATTRLWLGEVYLRMPRASPDEAKFHLSYALSYFTAMLEGTPGVHAHDDICRSHIGIGAAHSLLPAQQPKDSLRLVLAACERAATDPQLGNKSARLHVMKHALIGMQYYRFLLVRDVAALGRSREHLQIALDSCTPNAFEAFRLQISLRIGEICMTQRLWSEARGFLRFAVEFLSNETINVDPFRPDAEVDAAKNSAYCEAMAGGDETSLHVATAFRAKLIKRGFLEQLAASDSSVLDSSSYRKLLIPLREAQLALASSRPASGALIGQVEHEGLRPIQVYEYGNAEGSKARAVAQEHRQRFIDVRRLTSEFNSAFEQACNAVPTLQHLRNYPEKQIADSIEIDQALIVPVTVRAGTVVLIVTQEGVTHIDVPELTSTNLRMLVGQGRPVTRSWNLNQRGSLAFGYLGAYHNRTHDQAAWTSTLEQLLEILGRVFWQPVLAHLPKTVKRLAIVPDGPLSLLPIHAAYRPDAPSPRPIVADFAVSYTPSPDCLRLSQAVSSERHGNSLFCIVNPEEDEGLEWTKLEAEAITRHFAQKSVITGRRASRAAVLNHSKEFSCIHIAAHGFFDWSSVRRSGLRMSDAPITVEDIWLGLWDLTRARLVVLSACETGIIDAFSSVPSEMPGLPGALHLAGVPTVVGTLWPVDDVAAALVMSRFYSIHLSQGLDIPTALSRAQDWLRNASLVDIEEYAATMGPAFGGRAQKVRRDLGAQAAAPDETRPFRDPSFWAPYVCFGS
jgi:CHAT domain-containing protein